MLAEYRFTFALANGLHARPASMLADVARRFTAQITLAKESGGAPARPVDARSVLSVVGLDVRQGDVCLVIATGDDAAAAVAALREFIETRLAEADHLPPPPASCHRSRGGPDFDGTDAAKLPLALRRLDVPYTPGRPVCAGIGAGAAVIVSGLFLPPEVRAAKAGTIDDELSGARRAIAAVRDDLRRRSAAAAASVERDLLLAHAQIADDPALWAAIEREVRARATAPQAVVAVAQQFADQLRSAASAYIRDRVIDVQDVCMQLLDRLTGGRVPSLHISLDRDSVVFADTLTANQLLRMDHRHLRGLVLGHVGATSHTVIIARSLRIPTIIDVPAAATIAKAGDHAVVDGDGGFVIAPATPAVTRYYDRERATQQRRLDRLLPLARRPAVTLDGARLEVGANASSEGEITSAVRAGADGVGLLRTEVLFLERTAPPTESEQFEAYSAAVAAAAGRPIIIRAFDIGGDKPAPYLNMPREDNPFLGVRGLRLYERHPTLLRTQLRAILRASASGPVKVMAPMVATPAEAASFRAQVREVQAALDAEGAAFDSEMPVGIMIEVPAAAMVIDQLADEVDFFSIGTNDLCQYAMAVDRGNTGLSGLYNPRQPSFLRLLRTIVQGAKARSKWIGICGEMAGDPLNLPLMLGLGVDEISVAPGEVLGLKTAVGSAEATRCRGLLNAAAMCRDVGAVEALLRNGQWRRTEEVNVLDANLIEVGSDAASKEEAIKSAVDLLFVAGRTERPRDVEEAVWAREATYSTGLGYGFAVPHCKTDAVAAPTLAVVRLRTPVDWGSTDGLPVAVVMLLAIPASDTTGAHMKVFASLARRLMHQEFRDRLSAATDARAIEACLRQELGID